MNQTKVADLTVDEFRSLIKEVVRQTLADLIKDPDEGLTLSPETEVRLRESLAEYAADSSLTDAQSVATLSGIVVTSINFDEP